MREFKTTTDKVIRIPENISEMTVKNLIEFASLGELDGSMENVGKIISVFTDEPIQTIKFEDFFEMTNILGELLTTKPSAESLTEFTLNGVKYVGKNIEDMTTKEFIDFDTLSNEPIKNLPILLAIIYTEKEHIEEEYIAGVKRRADIFLNLDAESAQRGLVFFSTGFLNYAKAMVESLAQENPEIAKLMTELNLLVSDGAGN